MLIFTEEERGIGTHRSALIVASAEGNYEIALELIQRGAGMNFLYEWYGSALVTASLKGYYEILLLLQNDADLEAEGNILKKGGYLYSPKMREIIPNVNHVAEAFAETVEEEARERGTALRTAIVCYHQRSPKDC